MNARERLINQAQNNPVDRGVLYPERFWTETIQRWLKEGMPDNYDFGFDFDEYESRNCLGINVGFCPPFEEETIKDEGKTLLIRDEYGIIKRIFKNETGMPQFVSFPVKGYDSWNEMKSLLDPKEPSRFPFDWEKRIEKLNNADFPITTQQSHYSGFFGFLRELCGDAIYFLFYDEPDLIKEMLDFQVYRLTYFITKITKDIKIDRMQIWEDMCYNKGPLISPDLFREFFLEPYQRIIEVAKECCIPVIDVDSDGNIAELIPLWIEAGVNMLHPMEVAAGMDVVKIKKEYGSKLSIRGGVDKRALTREKRDIENELERIAPAYAMGGYIPHVDHSVPPNVPWDNYCYYLDKLKDLLGV